MPVIKLEKRLKLAGDVFAALMKRGWSCTDAADFVNSFPDADAVEVVHGRWEEHPRMTGYLRCSKCHDANIWDDWLKDGKWNYCPNCGAKMDGDGNV